MDCSGTRLARNQEGSFAASNYNRSLRPESEALESRAPKEPEMLSKYINKGEGPTPLQKATKAAPKQRSERTHGGFVYRGVAFTYAVRGDFIVLHTWNDQTASPNPGIVVKKSDKEPATWALTRIVLAERELENLGAKEAAKSNA